MHLQFWSGPHLIYSIYFTLEFIEPIVINVFTCIITKYCNNEISSFEILIKISVSSISELISPNLTMLFVCMCVFMEVCMLSDVEINFPKIWNFVYQIPYYLLFYSHLSFTKKIYVIKYIIYNRGFIPLYRVFLIGGEVGGNFKYWYHIPRVNLVCGSELAELPQREEKIRNCSKNAVNAGLVRERQFQARRLRRIR